MAETNESDLPERRQRFALEFARCLNGTQAAIRAGYAQGSAYQEAYRLLKNAEVQALIEEHKAQLRQLVTADAHQVVRELALIAFSDVTQFEVDRDTGEVRAGPELPPDATKAIASVKRKFRNTPGGRDVEVEIRLWPKAEAVKLLNQYLSLFKADGGDEDKAPFKVYLGFDPRELLCQPASPQPPTSPPGTAPTSPGVPPSG